MHSLDSNKSVQSMVHLNSAGCSRSAPGVVDAIHQYLQLESDVGGYRAAEERKDQLEGVYHQAAKILGCVAERIALIQNSTAGWQQVLLAYPFEDHDEVILSQTEYSANHMFFIKLKRSKRIRLVFVELDADHRIDPKKVEEAITQKTKMVCVTQIAFSHGAIQPVEEIGKICRKKNIDYMVDGCQGAGQLEIDVAKIQCDLFVCSSRKFLRGPRGIGFMYVSKRLDQRLTPLMVDLRSAKYHGVEDVEFYQEASRWETWERSSALMLGLSTAIQYALKRSLKIIQQNIESRRKILYLELQKIPSVEIQEPDHAHMSGIICIYSKAKPTEDIFKFLRSKYINTSMVRRSASLLDQKSHGLDMIRLSVHEYTTEAEIKRFSEVLSKFVGA